MRPDRRKAAVFAAVTGLVVTASLVPAPPDGPAGGDDIAPRGTDTLLHLIGYSAVAYALADTLVSGDGDDEIAGNDDGDGGAETVDANGVDGVGVGALPATVLVGVVVAATAVGAGVEVAQGIVPGRDPSVVDAAANAVGAVVGAAWWRRNRGSGTDAGSDA